MSSQYTHLAKLYDDFMYDVSYDDWGEYIKSLVSGKNIIEFACGTGNITKQLAKAGYNIIAVDISEEMLQVAQEKLFSVGKQAVFVCEDMTTLKLNKRVQSAICCCDGVNYIIEESGLKNFFANVYDCLEEGGVFTFDISSEHKVKNVLGNEFFYDDDEDQTLFWQNSLDGSLLTMNITLFIGKEEIYKRYDEAHLFKMWQTDYILQALKDCGFERAEAYGFLTKSPPKKDDERIQFYAKKAG